MCFPFSPWKRETHKQFDPHPFPGQSREVVYVYWFLSPPTTTGSPQAWIPPKTWGAMASAWGWHRTRSCLGDCRGDCRFSAQCWILVYYAYLHPSLIPPFALCHPACVYMYCTEGVVHSCQNELPQFEQVPWPCAGTWLKLPAKRERQLRREGLGVAGFELDPTNFAYLFCPTGFWEILLPFTCTLLFATYGIPGNSSPGIVPNKTPWKWPSWP